MSKILGRVVEFIEAKGLSNRAFELSIGLSAGVINKQVERNGGIGSAYLENCLNVYPDLSAEWLFRGSGNMFSEQSTQPPKGIIETQQEQITLLWESIAQLKDNAQRDREKIQNLERKISKTG